MKKLLAVALVPLMLVGALTLFGDNIRRLYGLSCDALAGDDSIPGRGALPTVPFHPVDELTGDRHAAVRAHAFTEARIDPLSTFAIDVDTASYTLARSALGRGTLPHPDSVRLEEWVNAFRYELPEPADAPFTVHAEGAPSPFSPGRTLLKVALQGRHIANADRLPAHLVFLVDTSGSMQGPDRLGLAQECLRVLLGQLNARDTVALVTYAGDVRDVLPPTPANQRETILEAIHQLTAGGGTAMGDGLVQAYRHALHGVSADSVSRVIVLSDGDANLGQSLTPDQMLETIGGYVKAGVTLTTVGFGHGNYRDDLMERLADRGNGQSVYVDSRQEALRVFGTQVVGTLEVIARDVKVQVEFNTGAVRRYRLLGYENRDVADRDFRNDEVDGGEIGAGHSVTALYEVELAPGSEGRLGTVRVRGQRPRQAGAFETELALSRTVIAPSMNEASTELRFAAAVAGAADILRNNPLARDFSLTQARALAAESTGGRSEREELVQLLDRAIALGRGSRVAGGAGQR